jgi:hypothetical protein
MKTTIALITLPVLLFGLTFSAVAQKTGEQMVKVPKSVPAVAAKVASTDKHCADCKVIAKSYRDTASRGVVKETKVVSRDLCPSCERKIVTTGVGKQAKTNVRVECLTKCCDLAKK